MQGSTVSGNFQIWKCLPKQVVRCVATRGNFLEWNPNKPYPYCKCPQGHFSFFISICSKVRVSLHWGGNAWHGIIAVLIQCRPMPSQCIAAPLPCHATQCHVPNAMPPNTMPNPNLTANAPRAFFLFYLNFW